MCCTYCGGMNCPECKGTFWDDPPIEYGRIPTTWDKIQTIEVGEHLEFPKLDSKPVVKRNTYGYSVHPAGDSAHICQFSTIKQVVEFINKLSINKEE